jgi:hypothetical protein
MPFFEAGEIRKSGFVRSRQATNVLPRMLVLNEGNQGRETDV